ncbi:hypothetical protein U1Q18_012680 [Sarracenia purpurea var. burkii]
MRIFFDSISLIKQTESYTGSESEIQFKRGVARREADLVPFPVDVVATMSSAMRSDGERRRKISRRKPRRRRGRRRRSHNHCFLEASSELYYVGATRRTPWTATENPRLRSVLREPVEKP